MALNDKLWETLTTVIKMNDRIVGMSAQMQAQQQRIEDLTPWRSHWDLGVSAGSSVGLPSTVG